MRTPLKVLLAVTTLAAAVATGAAAYTELDPQIAYQYTLYADEAKTQYIGEAYDQGCVVSGQNVYARRVQLHTPYFDATPMYICTGGGPTLPSDW
ncbi:hypothetical protein GCM10010203_47800 [Actinomadura yumaensis]|jgi:hypothetical protein